MSIFFQQVFALLSTPAGALTYQLVLAFSIGAALAGLIGAWRPAARQAGKRLLVGLSLLMGLRLILFAASGMVWQGALDIAWLAALDRAASVLALLVLLWMWVFPEPARTADAATLLIGLLAITLIVLGFVWWSEAGGGQPFAGALPDWVANLLALAVSAGGLVLLVTRRPAGWTIGVVMFAILASGHLLYLFLLNTPDGYAVVRLAEMIAYPFLLVMPQRYPLMLTEPVAPPPVNADPSTRPRAGADVFAVLTALVGTTDPMTHCPVVTRTIAEAMRADLCLWLSTPDPESTITVRCGYNRHSGRPIEEVTLTSKEVPVLAAMLRRGKSLRLPASSTSPDLGGLARRLQLDRTGHMLAVPLTLPDSEPLGGLVLISPYTDRPWKEADELFLSHITRLLAYVISTANIRTDVVIARNQLEDIRTSLALQSDELNELRSSAGREREQIERLQVMVAAQEAAHEVVSRLRAENETLRRTLQAAQPASTEQAAFLEGELRQALKEIARLQALLPEVDRQALAEGRAGAAEMGDMAVRKDRRALAASERQEIADLARELRQPMSSILGYTDFLLGESIGILGALQRKFLERIRVATERMDRLVKDLLHTVAPEDANWQLAERRPVDLSAAIDAAIAQISGSLREKDIVLRVDLPEAMPQLSADAQALHTVITTLLQNAGEATPRGGEILLRSRVEGDGSAAPGGRAYVLLQVADSGPGITHQDLPKVFGTAGGETPAPISGLGLGPVALAQARALVEKLGGRIWVDSTAGEGTTFSVLFSVLPAGQPADSPAGGKPDRGTLAQAAAPQIEPLSGYAPDNSAGAPALEDQEAQKEAGE